MERELDGLDHSEFWDLRLGLVLNDSLSSEVLKWLFCIAWEIEKNSSPDFQGIVFCLERLRGRSPSLKPRSSESPFSIVVISGPSMLA